MYWILLLLLSTVCLPNDKKHHIFFNCVSFCSALYLCSLFPPRVPPQNLARVERDSIARDLMDVAPTQDLTIQLIAVPWIIQFVVQRLRADPRTAVPPRTRCVWATNNVQMGRDIVCAVAPSHSVAGDFVIPVTKIVVATVATTIMVVPQGLAAIRTLLRKVTKRR